MSMHQAEITGRFINEFGSQRVPSEGQKFLWIHIMLENVGKNEITLPGPENFSILYAESDFKPIYGHRQGYRDYTTLGFTLFPEQELEAWLRFDIPITADLRDLWLVFLPEQARALLPALDHATSPAFYQTVALCYNDFIEKGVVPFLC